MARRILIVDDEEDIRVVIRDRLQSLGYAVSVAPDGQAALEQLTRGLPSLLFLDIEMPKMKGLELLRHIRKTWPELPVIIMMAYGSIALAVQAMKEGANDFITKPLDFQQLGRTIDKALEQKELNAEVAKLLGEISHEVKNLLQPMVCGTDLLESEIGDLLKKLPTVEAAKAEESHKLCDEVIGMLRNTTQRMQDRMKEIADYVNLMRTPLTVGPCRIEDVARQVLSALGRVAEARGIIVRCEGLDDLPSVVADEGRLFTVLYNLVNNAIAAVADGGSIAVRGQVDSPRDAICLAVEDTGHGMPPDVRDRLFTDQTISRKIGGTGLGLKIVKEAVEAHGGQITVQSTPGVGTTFHIVVPMKSV